MSDATSLIPTVKKLLVAALKNRQGLRDAKVDVKYSRPLDPGREGICLGSSLFEQSPGPMRAGRTLRDEDAQLTVLINASKPGQTGEDAELRAFWILSELENLLADDPNLSGDLTELGIANGLTVTTVQVGDIDPNVEGWEGLIRVTLTYSARLT